MKEFLGTYLPSTWEPGSGFIRDTKGNRSNQIDVIINDNSILKPLPYESGRGLFFVESVGIAIAVKSSLDKKQLRDAAENLRSVKKLRRSYPKGTERILGNYEKEVSHIVSCFIFAFKTTTSLQTVLGNLDDFNQEHSLTPEEQIDGVFILDEGLITNLREGEDRQQLIAPDGSNIFGLLADETKENTLLHFLRTVSLHLPKHRWVSSVGVLQQYVTNPWSPSGAGVMRPSGEKLR